MESVTTVAVTPAFALLISLAMSDTVSVAPTVMLTGELLPAVKLPLLQVPSWICRVPAPTALPEGATAVV